MVRNLLYIIKKGMSVQKMQVVAVIGLFTAATCLLQLAGVLQDKSKLYEHRAQILQTPDGYALFEQETGSKNQEVEKKLEKLLGESSEIAKFSLSEPLVLQEAEYEYVGENCVENILLMKRDGRKVISSGKTKGIYLSYALYTEGGYREGEKIRLSCGNQVFSFSVAGFIEEAAFHKDPQRLTVFYMDNEYYDTYREQLKNACMPVWMIEFFFIEPEKSSVISWYKKCQNITGTYGEYQTKESVKNTRMYLLSVITISLYSLAALLVLISLLVLFFAFQSFMEGDKSRFLVLRSMGYTQRELEKVFWWQYLGLLFGSLLLGSLLAGWMGSAVFRMCGNRIGLFIHQSFLWSGFLWRALPVLIPIVFELLYFKQKMKGRKTREISKMRKAKILPLTSISGEKKGVFGRLVLKDLWWYKNQSIALAIVSAGLVFVLSFSWIVYYNCVVRSDIFYHNFFINPSDIEIDWSDEKQGKELTEEFKKRDEIACAMMFESEQLLYEDVEVTAYISDDFSEVISPNCYEGRIPLHASEVAIGGKLAEQIGKQIGDEILLWYQGIQKAYLITGLLQAADLGMNAELTLSGMRRLQKDYPVFNCNLFVKEEVGENQIEQIKEEIEKNHSDVIAHCSNKRNYVQDLYRGYIELIRQLTLLVGLFFMGIGWCVLTLLLKMMHTRRKHQFQVQKQMGYTVGEIFIQFFFGYAAAVVLGAFAGALLAGQFLPEIISRMFYMIGIVQIRFDMNIQVFLSVITAVLLYSGFHFWVYSFRIKKQLRNG